MLVAMSRRIFIIIGLLELWKSDEAPRKVEAYQDATDPQSCQGMIHLFELESNGNPGEEGRVL